MQAGSLHPQVCKCSRLYPLSWAGSEGYPESAAILRKIWCGCIVGCSCASADQVAPWKYAGSESDDEVTSSLHPAKGLLCRSSPLCTKLPVDPSKQSFWTVRASSNQWLALQQAAEVPELVGAMLLQPASTLLPKHGTKPRLLHAMHAWTMQCWDAACPACKSLGTVVPVPRPSCMCLPAALNTSSVCADTGSAAAGRVSAGPAGD